MYIEKEKYVKECKKRSLKPLDLPDKLQLFDKIKANLDQMKTIYCFLITAKKFYAGYVYDNQFYKLCPAELLLCGFYSGKFTKDSKNYNYFCYNGYSDEFVQELSDFFYRNILELKKYT